MGTAEIQTRVTPEDLLRMPDGKMFELVNGELVERNTGGMSSWVGGRLLRLLGSVAEDSGLGWVLPADASYQCFGEDADRVRLPDVSFVRRGRFPGEAIPQGHITIAPDLAVEVVSPNDLYLDVQAKVSEYLRAGVRQVWVIDPENHTVSVHSAGPDRSQFLHAGDTLSGADIVPGFECLVADLFQTPE